MLLDGEEVPAGEYTWMRESAGGSGRGRRLLHHDRRRGLRASDSERRRARTADDPRLHNRRRDDDRFHRRLRPPQVGAEPRARRPRSPCATARHTC